MEQRLSKAAIEMLTGPMRLQEDPEPPGSVTPRLTKVSEVEGATRKGPRVQPPQLYGFVDPDLKAAFVARAKQYKLVNANVIVEGLYAWVSDTEWTPVILQWIREHKVDLIRKGIVKNEVFTTRVGAPTPLELHTRLQEACEGTPITVQSLIYVIVSHFVTDDVFADYIAEQAINRKIAALDAQIGG